MQSINDFQSIGSGGGGGGHPACASCKHQRKKCDNKCILAQYFPASKTEEFLAVQKCFGVSNVTKMIKNAREVDRKKIAESLIWEAMCRQRNPVFGSYGEYMRVYNELRNLKSKIQQTQNIQHLEQQIGGWNNNNNNSSSNNNNGIGIGVMNRGGVVGNYENGVVCNYNNIHDHQNGYDWSRYNSQYSDHHHQSKEEKENRALFPFVYAMPPQQQQQQHYSRAGFNPHHSPAN